MNHQYPTLTATKGEHLTVNAPHFFKDPAFLAWLNNGERKFTWHIVGNTPDDYSDVVVGLEPCLNGEGTDDDMPEYIWQQLVDLCRREFSSARRNAMESHILVRLTNMQV